MTLEKESRDAIGRVVRSLRQLFEEEFRKQASGRFGIRSSARSNEPESDGLDAWLDPVESLSLTPTEVAQRDELVHALRYLTSEGAEPGEAVARLIREAAFTAVNRLLAVRVAETIGVLPAVLSAGRQSAGFRDTVGDLFPGLAHDEDGYWIYVQVAGDELAPGVPRLFDRRHPTSAFVPSRACVDDALELLMADELAGVWGEPETLGWGYQFFNGDDIKQMRDASSAPRNSRELAVRNQFFTPRYVVDWLVQNTLGRRLVQAGYELELPLLVGEVGDHAPLELDEVRVLDPAVGSGHFLLGSYDLLEQAWQSVGVSPEEAAGRILPCLFGVDIDPRAAQVAQAVLLLRARRSAPDADVTPPTIVTAVALPHSKELREQVFGTLDPASQVVARDVAEALDQAPLLGTLLKVEQRLEAELTGLDSAPRLTDGDATTVLDDLHAALDQLVSTAASPEERMFTAEATDALQFLHICQQRYDTVLMNPPFGDPIPETKGYLNAAYGPASRDVYAAFVSRGLELLLGSGQVGAITSRSALFLTSVSEWRATEVVPRLRAVLDLGPGVMHDAMVQSAAYVLARQPTSAPAGFVDLLTQGNKGAALKGQPEIYTLSPSVLASLPESPVAYWLPEALFELFRSRPGLSESNEVEVKQGLATADDFRFVRLFWEVPAKSIGTDRRWVPFAKGGDYSPYYADLHLVVDWGPNGDRIRETGRARVQNTAFYFRPGIAWPRRSTKGFYATLVPSQAIFSHNGQMVFCDGDDPDRILALLGYLNSTLVSALVETLSPSGQFEVGTVGRLPTPDLAEADWHAVSVDVIEAQRRVASTVETNHNFVYPVEVGASDLSDRLAAIDESVSPASGELATPRAATTPRLELKRIPRQEVSAAHWLSYAMGVALGRWDVRCALRRQDNEFPSPFSPVPGVIRGMLLSDDDLPASEPPSGYPISVPQDRILHDDPGHEDDVVSAIGRVASLLEKGALQHDLGLPGDHDLRTRLRGEFFPDHLGQYSASRRYAPIYWQLTVPSKRWGLWLYAPSLSRESLFAIARAAREKLTSLNEQIYLAAERAESDRDARERAENMEDLAAEVERFAAVADEVAQSGWEPDLNDGFVLNAAPLEELFVDKKWRSQIAKHRKAMHTGEYAWATVQRDYFEKRT